MGGIMSLNKNAVQDSIGLDYAPVSLLEGGSVPNICSGKAVDFGIPSQAKAYARIRGLVTAGPALDAPANGQPQQRVIGQIIDNDSMQFLERLANLPIQKKVGKNGAGPPLLKVRVRDVDVQRVKEATQKKKKK